MTYFLTFSMGKIVSVLGWEGNGGRSGAKSGRDTKDIYITGFIYTAKTPGLTGKLIGYAYAKCCLLHIVTNQSRTSAAHTVSFAGN